MRGDFVLAGLHMELAEWENLIFLLIVNDIAFRYDGSKDLIGWKSYVIVPFL